MSTKLLGYRGSKYSAYEAGTRMPTVVHWPKEVKPGTSNALLSQVDLYASLAYLVNQKIEKGDAVDSQNFMDSWLGKSDKGRKYLLEESYTFGFRMDNWKYIKSKDKPVPNWIVQKFVDPGFRPAPQLFNLNEDPSEEKNLASEFPEIVAKMEAELKEIIKE